MDYGQNDHQEDSDKKLQWGFRLSWAGNWILLAAKLYAFVASRSKSVLASLADSAVDLVSQLVISMAELFMKRAKPHKYPVGRARLEALGVIGCACIMSIASIEVIQFSGTDLYNGFAKGELPELDVGVVMYAILGGGVVMKILLYMYCRTLKNRSDSMGALAEDHLNDVVSNAGAIVTATIASKVKGAWWVDPLGAIVISLWIISRWIGLTYIQVKKIVGGSAPEEFKGEVKKLADEHHDALNVDSVKAYHYGSRYNVEMEVILPADMTVAESHDIALELQQKIEAMEDVERAFVHVDYKSRDVPLHKVERQMHNQAKKARKLIRRRTFL
ncbi:Metal tolerance protein 9 [Coccomyxa sp. Obi]|nr:Metal tolerance protein 9 [Coccomyxa sp. Obi]